MNYLLDTHIFLWWVAKDPHLDKNLLSIIENPSHRILISVVNAWEVSIKTRAHKLPLKTTLEESFNEPGFEILSVTFDHIVQLHKLPLLHKDPFDRMLISQACVEKLTFITSDEKIWKYDISLLRVKS